jgi:hypothetical protein
MEGIPASRFFSCQAVRAIGAGPQSGRAGEIDDCCVWRSQARFLKFGWACLKTLLRMWKLRCGTT